MGSEGGVCTMGDLPGQGRRKSKMEEVCHKVRCDGVQHWEYGGLVVASLRNCLQAVGSVKRKHGIEQVIHSLVGRVKEIGFYPNKSGILYKETN